MRLKKAYLQELSRKIKAEEDLQIDSLPAKKRGTSLKLGADLDGQVQAYLRMLGGVVNTAIVIAAARGIILKVDRASLAEFWGHISLTKSWANSLLS